MTDGATVGRMWEEHRVAQVINTLFVSTDRRDWARVRGCFAPRVAFDMSSLGGGPEEQVSADQIAAGWEAGLKPIDSVHHQIGNMSIAVTGTEATASCYGIAYHYRRATSGRNTRLFVGTYDIRLQLQDATWRIDRFRFNLRFIDGNTELEREPRP
jgi:SnoaL-like domain